MALLETELKIVKVFELFTLNLGLPNYQRPYRWTAKSTNTLFQDIFEAFENQLIEYRLGTVILHKHNDHYDIVDGQQRLTTLAILLFSLGHKDSGLLESKYNALSYGSIQSNCGILKRRINDTKKENDQSELKDFILNHCSFVQIVTDNEQDAFQFFDSQNSRGKELAPHDLLKSYHLREMKDEGNQFKVKIVNRWESLNSDDLEDLFKNYIFPLVQWYRGYDGLGYSTKKIDSFKGIRESSTTNHAFYHKASHLYVEQFNGIGNREFIGATKINEFQLTQPLIAGKRFFLYTDHYGQLLETIQDLIKTFHSAEEIPEKRSGDIYIKQLYECALLFYIDRFGIKTLNKSVYNFFYTWSYSLRLVMKAVYPETINKYALGMHEKINNGISAFKLMSEMADPEGLNLILLQKPEVPDENKEKYIFIWDAIQKRNGWEV